MDYKYIEQLLERYWECQTTLEEEAILRTFFRQEDVPASLLPYRQLFLEEDAMANEHLGKDFADRMLQLVRQTGQTQAAEEENPSAGLRLAEGYVCKAQRLTVMRRLRPFYRVAGLVALLLGIGGAIQQSFTEEDEASVPQMAEAAHIDSLQHITISSPVEQSAALSPHTSDTLNAQAR